MLISSKPNKFIWRILFCFCVFLQGAEAVGESINFHAILVADLNADNLEEGVERDLQRMQGEVRKISKYTQLPITEKLFLGDISDPEELIDYLSKLEVMPDDVIFFYFSGHGFRTTLDGKLAWPSLAFEHADVGIRLEEIALCLEKKQARLTLIFADCCNNKMSLSNAPPLIKVKHKISGKEAQKRMEEGYRKLFISARGVLVIASAQAGEYSYADDDEGSFATIAWVKGLQELSKRPVEQISWTAWIDAFETLLAKIAKKNDVVQQPTLYNAIVEE